MEIIDKVFASKDPEKQGEIAKKGGQSSNSGFSSMGQAKQKGAAKKGEAASHGGGKKSRQ